MKFAYLAILLAVLVGGFFLVGSVARADCGAGTPGADNIVCDNNPAPPADDVEADAGNDNVTVDPGTTVTDDGADGNDNAIEGGPGNDTIINNGSVQGDIEGDGSTHPGGTGADSIVNNGTVDTCDGAAADCAGQTGEIEGGPGNDTITNNGSIESDIEGDEGDDHITNTGEVGDNIDGGEGNDNITNTQTGFVFNEISGDSAGVNGGSDTITNQGLVFFIIGDDVPGDGGDDLITNTNTGFVFVIVGDGADGNGGNDTIINNGSLVAIVGDATLNDGGDDLIINNGSVFFDIVGDEAGGVGGNDTITNTGTVDGDIVGDGACSGGNDLINNSGSALGIYGDGACFGGGNDTINHSGTVDEIDGEEGDDQVNITFGALVTGTAFGGENNGDFDVITFTQLTQAVSDAIAAQCPDPDTGCTINVNGLTYNLAEFESLQLFLAAVADAVANALEEQGVSVRRPKVICDDGAVKVIRDEDNNQWVFSGFNLLPTDGFLVAILPHDQLFPENVFSNPGAPAEGQGWTAVLDNTLHTRVYDAAGNLVSDRCLYRDEPNEPLTSQYGGNQ